MRLSKLQPPAPAANFFFFSRILFWRTDRRGYLYLKDEQNGRALEREYAHIDREFVALRIKFILSYFFMCAWFEIDQSFIKDAVETVPTQET